MNLNMFSVFLEMKIKEMIIWIIIYLLQRHGWWSIRLAPGPYIYA